MKSRQIKIFIATVSTPIIVGAVIVAAPAGWSHANPAIGSGVVYRTETRTPSSWDLSRAGLASAVITSRLGYPVTLRLNSHKGCIFTDSAVGVTDSEFASLVREASKNAPTVARFERC
jgi:hypothetical protein